MKVPLLLLTAAAAAAAASGSAAAVKPGAQLVRAPSCVHVVSGTEESVESVADSFGVPPALVFAANAGVAASRAQLERTEASGYVGRRTMLAKGTVLRVPIVRADAMGSCQHERVERAFALCVLD